MVERTPRRTLAAGHAALEDASRPISVDLAVFTLAGRELSVLLNQRSESPYPGFWALPGGLHRPGISLDAQARALHEGITGLEGGWIEQLKTFHRPEQTDPAGQVVVPGRLVQHGFLFRHPEWPEAARQLCDEWRALRGRPTATAHAEPTW